MFTIDNLHVSYGTVKVLHGISLHVKQGSIVSIIGSNGAGKTTLLNTISGLLKKSSGQIVYQGTLLSNTPHKVVQAGIVQIPEGRKVFASLSVRENLIMGGYLNKDIKNLQKSIDVIYEMFPILKDRKDQIAATLSGGEQQILAIGRGLMSKPKLLLLDEPSLGLAPKVVENVFEVISSFPKKGITVLLVEQNANKSLAVSDYAYVIENGKIIISGLSSELCRNPKIVESYLGIKELI
ncbi:MAG: ABC transporter ATP-binding protein [Dethiobacter sp.]|jgi:branched-chain amino acid transport system ATP-binding protein|nr:ABC transporter ATP-binding protein [Dethiobacter sp.]